MIESNLNLKKWHPVLNGDRYIIPTEQLECFSNSIAQWVESSTSGGIVWGLPRIGKTRAIMYFRNHVTEILKQRVPTFLHLCEDNQAPTENQFYSELLKDSNYAFYNSGKAITKRSRLVEFYSFSAHNVCANKVILFIDEAQWLTEKQYSWLMGVHNRLDKLDISLVTILVGQRELINRQVAFANAEKYQLVCRFMDKELELKGITTVSEVRKYLTGFDKYSEFPENSKISFTQGLLPQAYEKGFRLAKYSRIIFESFKTYCRKENLPLVTQIPMKVFNSVIQQIMRDLMDEDAEELEVNEELVLEAIRYTSYRPMKIYAG